MLFCSQCSFQCETISALANHVRWNHKREQNLSQCEFCNKNFDVSQLTTHRRKCSRIYSCRECGKITRNNDFCTKNCAARHNNKNGSIGYAQYRKKYGIIKTETYRDICFEYWPHECAICTWSISVDVHHIDKNHENNDPQNLIPLCQNHHMMVHMKEHLEQTQSLIDKKIKEKFMPG